jgi:hypothetical protein
VYDRPRKPPRLALQPRLHFGTHGKSSLTEEKGQFLRGRLVIKNQAKQKKVFVVNNALNF